MSIAHSYALVPHSLQSHFVALKDPSLERARQYLIHILGAPTVEGVQFYSPGELTTLRDYGWDVPELMHEKQAALMRMRAQLFEADVAEQIVFRHLVLPRLHADVLKRCDLSCAEPQVQPRTQP